MVVSLYLLLSLVFLWLFFRLWQLRQTSQTRAAGTLILQMVLFGLVYDSWVLVAGSIVGEGDMLMRLNLGRYVFFAVFTPLLMITGADFAARLGVVWAEKWYFQVVIWVAAICLVGLGSVLEWQFKDALVVERMWGTLRYVHPMEFLPFAPVLTNVVLIFLGGLAWWKGRWPWMLVGAVVMLVGGVIPTAWGGALISLGAQGILVGCLVATEQRLLTPDFSLTESELNSRISSVAGRSKKK
ncbi:MAG TPA: hypothetical protein PK530_00770 [Anaerolineales bacterium]|nr:hypothetical protein [Anaerolineales bacterium]